MTKLRRRHENESSALKIFRRTHSLGEKMTQEETSSIKNYRKSALEHYRKEIGGNQINVCVVCGFGIPSVLEVAHLDQDRSNSDLENLAVLCPNCHKMHDIGLFPTEIVKKLRDEHRKENWGLRVKDAGIKAAATRKASAAAKAKSAAGKKAWASRIAKNKEGTS